MTFVFGGKRDRERKRGWEGREERRGGLCKRGRLDRVGAAGLPVPSGVTYLCPPGYMPSTLFKYVLLSVWKR